jgi:hypothetical protein
MNKATEDFNVGREALEGLLNHEERDVRLAAAAVLSVRYDEEVPDVRWQEESS